MRIISLILSLLLVTGTVQAQEQLLGISDYYIPVPVWSTDNAYVAVSSAEVIKVWNIKTGESLSLIGHTDKVLGLAWHPIDNILASASTDQTVRLWNGTDGTLLRTLEGEHGERAGAIAWSSDGNRIVSMQLGSELATLYVWDAETGTLLSTHRGGSTSAMAFSPDDTRFVYVAGTQVHILDGGTFEPLVRYTSGTDRTNIMHSVAWRPDGTRFATGSMGGAVYVWDAQTAQPLFMLPANDHYDANAFGITNPLISWVRDVAWSPDGSQILAISGDGTLHIWNVQTHQILNTFHVAPLAAASFSSYTGQLVYIGIPTDAQSRLADGVLIDHIVNAGVQIVVPDPSPERLQVIAESCNAESALTDSLTDFAAQLDALDIPPACQADLLAILPVIHAQENERPNLDVLTSKVEWGQTGQYIVIGTLRDGISIYEATSRNRLVHIPYSETGMVIDLALSPDETMVVARGEVEQSINIWDTQTGQLLQTLQTDVGTFKFAWSPDGQLFASSGLGGTRVWDASSGQMLLHISANAEDTPSIAFSQDDRLVINWSGSLDIWDLSSQQRVKRVRLGGLRASIQWSSDNLHLLMPNTSNLREGTFYSIKIWNVDTEEVVQEFDGFPAYLTSARWNPDETQILSTDLEGNVYITDVLTGTTRHLLSSGERILSGSWSPYGGQIAVGIAQGSRVSFPQRSNVAETVPMPINGILQIITPDPSPERLQAIAESCNAESALTGSLADFAAQLDALDIPPACQADLLAVAAALETE